MNKKKDTIWSNSWIRKQVKKEQTPRVDSSWLKNKTQNCVSGENKLVTNGLGKPLILGKTKNITWTTITLTEKLSRWMFEVQAMLGRHVWNGDKIPLLYYFLTTFLTNLTCLCNGVNTCYKFQMEDCFWIKCT